MEGTTLEHIYAMTAGKVGSTWRSTKENAEIYMNLQFN